ncbi:MAG: hypothetical protein JO362_11990 [Streptomycetaceae bacterium]|nr:hypothetical protein [Streptomycetaceae bacterium]
MANSQAQHKLRKRRGAKIALAGIAGLASAAAVLAGSAQAASNDTYVVDSGAHYSHAVSIWVDNQFRRCVTLSPGGSTQFGPNPNGSYVWIREYTGGQCYDGSAPLKTVQVWNVKPGQTIDLSRYPVNGAG